MSDDEIFCAALELETEAKQRELVESCCEGDTEQLQRVWELLSTNRQMQGSDDDNQSILDRPDAVFQAFSGGNELMPGKQIGKYVLGELIGQGATSLVFRARQLKPVVREVALKLLKPGMDSQRILARFGLEHQVIERLEHPGVTPVYDVGVQDNGRPFFAMELVPDPLNITEYVERFALDLRSRVQLMIATCDIVQHAHQRGVIHRDLKPSNILIEGVAQAFPKPRIIDFGIAKIMQPSESSSNFTTLGDRFGTPAYMSPEQALLPAGSVDIRSDVYSLGAILYELLTGLTPRTASIASTIELSWTSSAYWEYEIKAPSRTNRLQTTPQKRPPLLKRILQTPRGQHSEMAASGTLQELDWITLKAIAKDPQDRYQTVADMQRDLQRFLNGEPVEAAGPSLAYRVKKLINRNRNISIAATVTLLTIIITSVMTTSYAFQAHDAQQQAQLQLQETLDAQQALLLERDRAEESMRQSQSLLRVFQVQAVTLRSLTRYTKQVIDASQIALQEGQSVNGTSPKIDVEVLTTPHNRLIVKGDWTWASGNFPAEIINASFQLSSREAAQAVTPLQERLPYAQNGEKRVSLQASQQQPIQHGTDHPDAPPGAKSRTPGQWEPFQVVLLEELRAVLPNNDPFIAEVLDNCGLLALERNVPADAALSLTESIRIWEQCKSYPANLAQSQLFLAEALCRLGRSEDAESLLDKTSKSLDRIPAENPDIPALRQLQHQLRTQLKSVGSRNTPQLGES